MKGGDGWVVCGGVGLVPGEREGMALCRWGRDKRVEVRGRRGGKGGVPNKGGSLQVKRS